MIYHDVIFPQAPDGPAVFVLRLQQGLEERNQDVLDDVDAACLLNEHADQSLVDEVQNLESKFERTASRMASRAASRTTQRTATNQLLTCLERLEKVLTSRFAIRNE